MACACVTTMRATYFRGLIAQTIPTYDPAGDHEALVSGSLAVYHYSR